MSRWVQHAAFGGVLVGVLGGALGCGDDEPPSAGPAPVAEPAPVQPAAPVASVANADLWLDLLAQRPSATVSRVGALWVDLGSKTAVKHVSLGSRSAWRLAEKVDGRAAGVVVGRSASLEVPLDGSLSPKANVGTEEEPGLAMAVEVHPLAPNQRMTVLLNERPLANLVLEEGWARRTFSLPEDLVRAGENQVRFYFRSVDAEAGEVSGAVSSVVVGPRDRIISPPAGAERRDAITVTAPSGGEADALSVRSNRDSGGMVLSAGTGLAYYFVPPPRARLALEVAGQGALSVSVSTDADHEAGRPPTRLIEEPLRGSGQSVRADLSGWGDTPVRLEISVRGEGASATFNQARVDVSRSIPVDRRARRPRDLFVLTVEGMRADALEVGRRPSLPNLEAFVASSLVFERAYAPSPAAIPSHAAWLSSAAPPRHLTVRGTFIADNHVLLPEALERGGYVRVLATANTDLNVDRGLLQGIDAHSVLPEVIEAPRATAVLSDALERLEGKAGRWYMHANVNDPQAPYDPPRELVRETTTPEGSPLPHLSHIWVGRVRLGKTVPTKEELVYMRRLYRGELQVVDEALGQLIHWLERERRLQDAIVVVLGVHGEEFYEHLGAGHARTLYEESLRVPLAIRAPSLLAAGRVGVAVDLLDVAPTLLDLQGLGVPDRWQGRSLIPVIDDPQPPPQAVGAYLGDGSRAMVVGRHKLVLGPGRKEEYTDLTLEPGEDPEVPSAPGIGLRIVRTALAWELWSDEAWRRARWGTGANLTATFARDWGM